MLYENRKHHIIVVMTEDPNTREENHAVRAANISHAIKTMPMANDLPSTDQRGPVSPQSSLNIPTQELACRRQAFQHDGFVLFHNAINKPFVSRLQSRLEHVLRGRFDRGKAPDKMPIILNDDFNDRTNYPPLGFHPHNSKKRVIQIINVHKCDATFREIATCAEIGRMVGHLAGWDAVRLAQDQVWAK